MATAQRVVATNPGFAVSRARVLNVTTARTSNISSGHLEQLAQAKATPISLSNLFRFGNKPNSMQQIHNAQFLHRELPVRFAQRVQELSALPLGLSQEAGIREIRDLYESCLSTLTAYEEPQDTASCKEFKERLREMLTRKDENQVVRTLSLAIRSLYDQHNGSDRNSKQLDEIRYSGDQILSRFFMARIGLRFIIEQYLHSENPAPSWSGVIHSRCNPVRVAEMAAEDAMRLADYHLGAYPVIEVVEENKKGDQDGTFTYIPKHMHYILLELLKNACRATVSNCGGRGKMLPKIEVIVVHGEEDVTIKISDRGGGIPRSEMRSIWTFMYSTAPAPASAEGETSLAPTVTRAQLGRTGAIAGYGVGLPMSRLYARYFGGDLDIKSVEGLGTDCYLFLPKLGTNCENLPEVVARSPGELDSSIPKKKQAKP